MYERLINVTDDPGIKDALGFLMSREIAHQMSFEKALHSIQLNFPQGKMPGDPEFNRTYFNMSHGGEVRGSWNEGQDWVYVDQPQPAVDGGNGMASVELDGASADAVEAMKLRTQSNPDLQPMTGAELGKVNGDEPI